MARTFIDTRFEERSTKDETAVDRFTCQSVRNIPSLHHLDRRLTDLGALDEVETLSAGHKLVMCLLKLP